MRRWISNLFSSSPGASMMRLLCLIVGGAATVEMIIHFDTLTERKVDLLKTVFGLVFGFKFGQSVGEHAAPYLADKFAKKDGSDGNA